MGFSLSASGISGILLDIEGTTTPIQFVYETLFPYVRQQLHSFLTAKTKDIKVQEILRALRLEQEDDFRAGRAVPDWSEPPLAYIEWLMDQDRKSTALKVLQGLIWFEGYQNGNLKGVVFKDVAPALERWKHRRIDIRIFSSGSELAQRLLFGSTSDGDLTPFLNGYFDTTFGPKGDPSSYSQIAAEFQLGCDQILFISDVTRELDAAKKAGMKTLLCMRPGNHPQVIRDHSPISSFDQIAD